MGGGSPKIEAAPAVEVKAPKSSDKETQEAIAAANRRRARARGYRSTVVASSMMSQTNPALKTTLGS